MRRGFIENCEREQLHLSGAIQGHGALVRFDGTGRITHASANLRSILGMDAESVLGADLGVLELPDIAPIAATDNRTRRQSVVRHGVVLSVLAITGADDGVLVELIPQPRAVADNPYASYARHSRTPADEAALRSAQEELVAEVARRTGYERVMYYRFHPDGHGEVIAEARNGDAYGSYLGLRFPASDIPSVARALYLKNPWRMIPDATADSVPLLSRSADPVDLTRSDLRSVSEVHRAYLANMGVRSALSFPVAAGDSLEALISCHHSAAQEPDVGLLVELGSLVTAHAVGYVSYRAGQRMRLVDGLSRRFRDIAELIENADGVDDVWPVLGPRLVSEFDADGAMLCVGDDIYSVGEGFDDDTLARVEEVSLGHGAVVWHSDSLSRDIDGLLLTPVAGAAGVLVEVPMGDAVRVWVTRSEFIDEVSWGGNPDKPVEPGLGDEPISPRRSFETWVERRLGYSRPWPTETELLLRQLRTAIGPLAARS
ncbi:MAG: GAF domain-containing protein [Mycobacterium sp.]|nr:GAF domain-containing protein [Mycobacterium sp.]